MRPLVILCALTVSACSPTSDRNVNCAVSQATGGAAGAAIANSIDDGPVAVAGGAIVGAIVGHNLSSDC